MRDLVIVAVVNFRFLDKGEEGGDANYGSRDYSRRGGGEQRGRGEGGPRSRGKRGSSIEVLAAITGTARIVLSISLSRLHISVGVYSMILS